MNEPPSPTVGAQTATVIGADEQSAVDVDVDRWCRLARDVLVAEGAVGELTLTFIDADEIAALNAEHLGHARPTDVLSFPLDTAPGPGVGVGGDEEVPVLLGDVVVCPEVAVAQAPEHAGTLEDELALLVVHGVLHVLGHDHAQPAEAELMRARERALLVAHHWGHAVPPSFRQQHVQ